MSIRIGFDFDNTLIKNDIPYGVYDFIENTSKETGEGRPTRAALYSKYIYHSDLKITPCKYRDDKIIEICKENPAEPVEIFIVTSSWKEHFTEDVIEYLKDMVNEFVSGLIENNIKSVEFCANPYEYEGLGGDSLNKFHNIITHKIDYFFEDKHEVVNTLIRLCKRNGITVKFYKLILGMKPKDKGKKEDNGDTTDS